MAVMDVNVPHLLRRRSQRVGLLGSILLVFLALLLQRVLPLYLPPARHFDWPLLILTYLSLTGRNVEQGIVTGAAIGLAQDALTHGPMGVFGIIKTLIGYLGGSISLVIETDFPGARSVLAALFFLIHQLLYWTMQRVLLATEVPLDAPLTLIMSAAHAALAAVMFRLFDRLKGALKKAR